jgi:hypothetical protein
MAYIKNSSSHNMDCVTGERIDRDVFVVEVPFRNKGKNLGASRLKLLKEETIVWLAEEAGYVVTKRDGGDSGDAAVVDGADVIVGGGEDSVGAASAGGRKPVKRRSDGSSKGK